jgi:predicted  nucleic acid-binding Zn-ribbon protein
MPGEVIGLVAVICIFGWPILMVILKHQRQMAEMRMNALGKADQSLLAELQELKRQMEELRDTTTRYDMSFDSALQRMESRMGNVEQKMRQIEQEPAQPAAVTIQARE